MAKRGRITISQIEKMQKQGRGLGQGNQYRPWQTIRDVNSKGFKHRIYGWKTERTHHLFSNLELSFFFWLEWLVNVVDIRERYPLLPIENSIDIAAQLGVKHPYDYKKNEHVIMTTDFLVDHQVEDQILLKAYSVMTSKGLSSTRVLKKTLIERNFWRNLGIEFTVITEKEIPKELANNVNWLRSAKDFDLLPIKDYEELLYAEKILSESLDNSFRTIAKSCLLTDNYLSLKPGSSIQLVKHLIANRYWKVDLTKKITTNQPLQFQRNVQAIELIKKEIV